MNAFNEVIGLGIVVLVVIIIRLFGAWILRINDVINVQKEILAEIKKINARVEN